MTSPIDYSNASYTRVYNDYQAELEVAGWQARALFWHIQHRMDRAGVFRFGALDMVGLIARRTGIPVEAVQEHLPILLDHGLLVVRGETLVDPEFVASQTTSKTNKQRQREHRDKRRSDALSSPPPSNEQQVLQLDEKNRNETVRVTDVTHGEEKVSDREDLNSSLSSQISEQPACQVVELPAQIEREARVGYRWLDDLLGSGGRAPSLEASKRLYAEIGRAPATERQLVAKHLLETKWIVEDYGRARPDHIRRWWAEYVKGPRNFDQTQRRDKFSLGVHAPAQCDPREAFADYTNPDFVSEPMVVGAAE